MYLRGRKGDNFILYIYSLSLSEYFILLNKSFEISFLGTLFIYLYQSKTTRYMNLKNLLSFLCDENKK